ncbi:MAG TPA: hypothetical protein PLX89_15400 [Verrucomicrobiota bacterium]|nr:hypothetical protein [Verrucomicrobiales bacterium]HRI14379.1 hypothetical protein [Verrucomicrobiota bacterium]
MIDPELGLLPEFSGHSDYWLYHDNYLAAKVLDRSYPDEAERVRQAIAKQGIARSGKIELLFSEAQLPLRRYELRDVAKVGNKTIRSEFTTAELFAAPERYADLLFFIAVAEPDAAKARAAYDSAMAMWDNVGFHDAVVIESGRYATYKLGLALRVAERFHDQSEALAKVRERLLKLQNPDGGWITDYQPDGTPIGMANVETTCLAILGLEAGGLPVRCNLRPEFARLGLKQRSQGKRDTCSVFSTVESTEFALARSNGKGVALSVEYANWAANETTGRGDDGDFFHNIILGIQKHGVCPEEAMPYAKTFSPDTQPNSEIVAQAAAFTQGRRLHFHWLKGWSKKAGLDDRDLLRVKTVLASGSPVSAGSYHSVLFVGYEEDTTQPGGGRFLISDSNLKETEISYQAAKERFSDLFWVNAEVESP